MSRSVSKSQNKQSTGADLRSEPGARDEADERMRQTFTASDVMGAVGSGVERSSVSDLFL